MKVLVCGGRAYSDKARLWQELGALYAKSAFEVIEGGATGADTLAREWAAHHGIPCHTYAPKWAIYGLNAGPIRNREMIEVGQPDLVVAFPGGRGTANMVKQAKAAGIKITEVTPDHPAIMHLANLTEMAYIPWPLNGEG